MALLALLMHLWSIRVTQWIQILPSYSKIIDSSKHGGHDRHNGSNHDESEDWRWDNYAQLNLKLTTLLIIATFDVRTNTITTTHHLLSYHHWYLHPINYNPGSFYISIPPARFSILILFHNLIISNLTCLQCKAIDTFIRIRSVKVGCNCAHKQYLFSSSFKFT